MPGHRHRLRRREAVGDPPARGRRRLPRGAHAPQPRREAGRPRGPDRRRRRLRRPVRGQGRADEEGRPTHAASTDGRLRAGLPAGDVPPGDGRSRRREPAQIDERRARRSTVHIEPHGQWTTELDVETVTVRPRRRRRPACRRPTANAPRRHGWTTWRSGWPGAPRLVNATASSLAATYRRSLVDLAALRFSPAHRRAGAACPPPGLPWFMTMFGRDSILTSLQALPFAPELAATTLRVLGALAGQPRRRLPRRGPGQDPARAALRRADRVRGAAALAVLRLRRRHAAVPRPARRVRALDRRRRRSSASSSRRRAPRCTGSTTTATCTATATSRTSGATRRPASRTSAGRTPGTRSRTATAGCPASRARPASCRATPTTPRCGRARLARRVLERPGVRRPAGAARRPTSSARFNRDFWIEDGEYFALALDADGAPGRLAHLEHRPPAVERHRRRRQGQGRRRPPDRAAAVLRLGRAHAGRGRGPVQPDRLPRRHGVAVRQLVHRLGPAPLRLQGRGGARSPPASSRRPTSSTAGCPRRSAATARSLTKYPVEYPTACSPQAWSTGRAAAAAAHACSGSSRSAST